MSDTHHHHHHHHHDHDVSLPVADERPLDPASQSLADALKASFGLLKVIMFVLVIAFLASGVFQVDANEEVVLLRFGKPVGDPLDAGLAFAWPYPIDEKVRVSTLKKTIEVDAFWLRLTDEQKGMDLSALPQRSGGLDPAREGALITGDRALMHLLFRAQYEVVDAAKFVENVKDEKRLLESVLRSAAVAEAARTTADVVWQNPSRLVAAIKSRSQKVLNDLEAGIKLGEVTADESYPPLQAKREFLDVSGAENRKRQLIQAAIKEREETLNEAAGPAWQALSNEISKLEQLDDGQEREEVIERIGEILETDAKGKAAEKIQAAKQELENILARTLSRRNHFLALLDEYQRNPQLVRRRLRQDMLDELWQELGLDKVFLHGTGGQNVFWINKDPLEMLRTQQRLMEEFADRERD